MWIVACCAAYTRRCLTSLELLRTVSSDVEPEKPSGVAGFECIAGWQQSPKEEVPVSHSCSKQGLLIAENAG